MPFHNESEHDYKDIETPQQATEKFNIDPEKGKLRVYVRIPENIAEMVDSIKKEKILDLEKKLGSNRVLLLGDFDTNDANLKDADVQGTKAYLEWRSFLAPGVNRLEFDYSSPDAPTLATLLVSLSSKKMQKPEGIKSKPEEVSKDKTVRFEQADSPVPGVHDRIQKLITETQILTNRGLSHGNFKLLLEKVQAFNDASSGTKLTEDEEREFGEILKIFRDWRKKLSKDKNY